MSDVTPSQEVVVDGGLKAPDAKPDPLVGEDRKTQAPVERTERIVREHSDGEHGADAVAELALERAIEADKASPKDERTSAEAVDQGSHVRPVDIERAELDAASHAELLSQVEDDTSADAVGVGVRAAGDRVGDHVHNVRKVAEAASDEDGPKAAHTVIDERDRVESPHGRTAESHDAWQAARWAPHGDLNVPAESYGEKGVLGLQNPTTRDQVRGMRGDSDEAVADAKREAGPGESIATERYRENQKAAANGRAEASTLQSFGLEDK